MEKYDSQKLITLCFSKIKALSAYIMEFPEDIENDIKSSEAIFNRIIDDSNEIESLFNVEKKHGYIRMANDFIISHIKGYEKISKRLDEYADGPQPNLK